MHDGQADGLTHKLTRCPAVRTMPVSCTAVKYIVHVPYVESVVYLYKCNVLVIL